MAGLQVWLLQLVAPPLQAKGTMTNCLGRIDPKGYHRAGRHRAGRHRAGYRRAGHRLRTLGVAALAAASKADIKK